MRRPCIGFKVAEAPGGFALRLDPSHPRLGGQDLGWLGSSRRSPQAGRA
ncbi:MAG: hypothetical protein ACLQGP_06245 [Isosphaeraceae bacterium]